MFNTVGLPCAEVSSNANGILVSTADYQRLYLTPHAPEYLVDENQFATHFTVAENNGFCLLENDFGLGVNFLLTWAVLSQLNDKHARLRYVAIQAAPLLPEDLTKALSRFPALEPYRLAFMSQYPPPLRGWHLLKWTLASGASIELLLIQDTQQNALKQLFKSRWRFDAFYLSLATSTQTDEDTEWLTRLHKLCASKATLSAIGHSHNSEQILQAAGFNIESRMCKKERVEDTAINVLRASYTHARSERRTQTSTEHFPIAGRGKTQSSAIAIIGNGIAACTCAWALAEKGVPVVVIAKREVGGTLASHDVALAGPRWSKDHSVRTQLHLYGFELLRATLLQADFHEALIHTGAIDLGTDEALAQQWQTLCSLGLDGKTAHLLSDNEAESIAGVKFSAKLGSKFIYDQLAVGVSAKALCRQLLQHPNIQQIKAQLAHYAHSEKAPACWQLTLDNQQVIKASNVVFCSGVDMHTRFPEFPTHLVRGQTCLIAANMLSQRLSQTLRFGSYLCPSQDGKHLLGATFEHDTLDADLSVQSHQENLSALHNALPELFPQVLDAPLDGHIGFRVTTRDRMPVIGAHPQQNGVWINTAHGAQGLMTSFVAAQIIADTMMGDAPAMPTSLLKSVSPLRFLNP